MMGWGGYGGYGRFGGGALGWIGPIMMLLFWVGIIAVIFFAIRFFIRQGSSGGSGFPGGKSESALDILKRRYANGEIKREEFEEMKKTLKD